MSFAARLVHELTHVAVPLDPDVLDDRGQPTAGTPVTTSIRGLVQPRTAREMADSRSAGSEIADHVIFLAPMTLSAQDHFLYGTDRLDIVGIRRFEYGRTPHLEVDAQRVTPALVEAGS